MRPWLAKKQLDLRTIVPVEELLREYYDKKKQFNAVKYKLYVTEKTTEDIQHEIERWYAIQQQMSKFDDILKEEESKIDNLNLMLRSAETQQGTSSVILSSKITAGTNSLDNLIAIKQDIDSAPKVLQGLQPAADAINTLERIQGKAKKVFAEYPGQTTFKIKQPEQKVEKELKKQPKIKETEEVKKTIEEIGGKESEKLPESTATEE